MSSSKISISPSASALNLFGKTIYFYAGQGRLLRDNGKRLPCRFEIGQLQDGSILALCHVPPGDPYQVTANLATRLNGRSDDGHMITAWHDCHMVAWHPNMVLVSGLPVSFVLSFNEARVQFAKESPASVAYALTNLSIDGFGSNRGSIPLRLKSNKRRRSITLRRVPDYEEEHVRLQVARGVAVTAQAVADARSHQQLSALDRVLDSLCYILSVARGTKVNWVYREVYSGSGTIISRYHAARITRDYSEFGPIPPFRDHVTKRYVETVYPVYAVRKRKYFLEVGTIDAYLDARSEEDYLQTRGAKMAVALEALKAVYIREHGITDSIIDESVFEKARQPLRKAITEVLVAHGVKKKTAKRIASKSRELNRLPFRDILCDLFREIVFTPHEDETKLFVACRNKLVHEGRFYSEAAGPAERASVPPLPTIYEEFVFLANFLDRVMLHLLGYKGMYIDRRYWGRVPQPWRLVTDTHWPHPALSTGDVP